MEYFETFFEEDDSVANEFIASNLLHNWSRIIDLDQLSLGLSNIGVKRMISNLRQYVDAMSKSKISKSSENMVIYEPSSLEFIKKNNAELNKYYKILTNPNSCKLSLDQIEDEVKKSVDKIRESYKYLSERSNLKSKGTKNKSDMITYAKLILKASTDIHVDPQKTIVAGYKALNDMRIKHNKAQSEATRKELNTVEEAFEFWQKAKSFAYHLLNNDLDNCYGSFVNAYNEYFRE